MARFVGGCACDRARYALSSEPLFVHCCHCLRCQRETGSAFVLNALIEAERFELTGATPVAVPTDSGKPHRIFRCETCGTALASEYGGVEKLRFVRVGTLDDPHAFKPDVHIYTRSKVPWVALPQGIPAFEAYYDWKKLWPEASVGRRVAVFG